MYCMRRKTRVTKRSAPQKGGRRKRRETRAILRKARGPKSTKGSFFVKVEHVLEDQKQKALRP